MAKSVRRSGFHYPRSRTTSCAFYAKPKSEEIVITRNGKPAGLLIGFVSEDDWLGYRLENDPRFLRRIGQARKSLREGHGVKIEDVE